MRVRLTQAPPRLPPSGAYEANARRNAAGADRRRHRRWAPARAALWRLLDPVLASGGRVAVVGAGNGDTVPLRRIAEGCDRLDLIDLDAAALERARRRCGSAAAEVRTIVEDVTDGMADHILAGLSPGPHDTDAVSPAGPVGTGVYDIVIGDLLFSQLLYPALSDTRRAAEDVDRIMLSDGQRLTDAVVGRLAVSTPGGLLVCVHDVLGWWPGHPQPFTLQTVLEQTRADPAAAATLVAVGNLPYGCDPRPAAARVGELAQTVWWRWPFSRGTDYLVRADLTRVAPAADGT